MPTHNIKMIKIKAGSGSVDKGVNTGCGRKISDLSFNLIGFVTKRRGMGY
jgi:hypothetical protein